MFGCTRPSLRECHQVLVGLTLPGIARLVAEWSELGSDEHERVRVKRCQALAITVKLVSLSYIYPALWSIPGVSPNLHLIQLVEYHSQSDMFSTNSPSGTVHKMHNYCVGRVVARCSCCTAHAINIVSKPRLFDCSQPLPSQNFSMKWLHLIFRVLPSESLHLPTPGRNNINQKLSETTVFPAFSHNGFIRNPPC
jgi:hypothetical protein